MPEVDREKVLAENASWQSQLIEAFGICPYARSCREAGRLWRDVLDVGDEDAPENLTQALVALHRSRQTGGQPWEIALLICPNMTMDAVHFERMIRQCGDHAAAQVQAEGLEPQFLAVAFHPGLAFSPADPSKLVGFWRRSPHPTVQLVHKPTLSRLHDARLPTKYVDPEDLEAVQALLGQTVSGDLADRIALANWRTYHAQNGELLARSAQLLMTPGDS